MRVRTKVIREGRALYLLEDVALPEGQPLVVTIEIPTPGGDGSPPGEDIPHLEMVVVDEDGDVLDEDGIPIQETLADVLGFDPDDPENEERLLAEGERQRKALLEMAMSSTAASDPPHDGAVNHDKYLYGDPYR